MSMRLAAMAAAGAIITHVEAREDSKIRFPEGEGRTKQSMRDECDINNILARYKKMGMVTHLSKNEGRFADVAEIGDFREAVERVERASEFFFGLPSDVRRAFDNDPATFLDAVQDPSRRDELVKLGLVRVLEKPAEPAPAPAPEAPAQ